jgi:L-alanine-DL-glutamate epimerase-like enolase superfamily enzyme
MKITSVTTAATAGHCMHLWVKIETDAGITGLGECVHGGHQAIALIRHELGPHLIGRDPFAIDALFEEMRRGRVFEGGFAGALITALTGIEIALGISRARRSAYRSMSFSAASSETACGSTPTAK